jgi:hypothetical protein
MCGTSPLRAISGYGVVKNRAFRTACVTVRNPFAAFAYVKRTVLTVSYMYPGVKCDLRHIASDLRKHGYCVSVCETTAQNASHILRRSSMPSAVYLPSQARTTVCRRTGYRHTSVKAPTSHVHGRTCFSGTDTPTRACSCRYGHSRWLQAMVTHVSPASAATLLTPAYGAHEHTYNVLLAFALRSCVHTRIGLDHSPGRSRPFPRAV